MSRIEELERRVQQDPASIAFGALAEEYRRAGRLEDAIVVCRAGLERHPSYLSARVTLGRALQALGQLDDARAEFERVIDVAPDNLAAIRALAELHGGEPREPSEPTERRTEPREPEEPREPMEPAVPAVPAVLQVPVPDAVRALEQWLDVIARERAKVTERL